MTFFNRTHPLPDPSSYVTGGGLVKICGGWGYPLPTYSHNYPRRQKRLIKNKNLQPNSTFLGCPLGYHSAVNNWTCYNGYDTPLSFSDAQTACKNTWSNLVTINNAFENSDIAGKKLSFFNNI